MKFKKFLPLILSTCLLFGCGVEANEANEAKTVAPPFPTAEFEQMDYPPIYPTYSWLTLPMTEFYKVQLMKIENGRDKLVRELYNTEAFNRVTDWTPLIEPGDYYWQVCVIDKDKRPLSDWSEPKYFKVSAPVEFAVLGDSISHGGASYIPAGQLACQWETYSDVPIKNLARSGDTTQMMLDRFDNDVLPFKPRVLVIMGGVNDVRMGMSSDVAIKNLETIRDKCIANGITPVFCTLTSMNPEITSRLRIPVTESDWQSEREQINRWIVKMPHYIDVASKLTDENGYLRADLTPDGLHPGLRGKKLMGEVISAYLKQNF